MKEVTPYFQKAMLLAEIGWENRPPFLSPASSNGNEDGEPDGAGGDFSRLVHTGLSFSSCQWNLIETFQIDAIVALITKMTLICS